MSEKVYSARHNVIPEENQVKKFLDAEGVKYLWSKINMQDYPNNETLMNVIEAIDETKADKSELFSGSWNDLEEKPFYSDETILAHVENVEEYVHTEDGSFYFSAYFGNIELPENISSLVGANVSATINGTQINGVLKEVTYYSDYWLSDATSVAMGNLHLLNNKSDSLVDTGEDWCISVDVGEHYPYDHAVAFTLYGRQNETVTIESLTCFTGGNIKTLDEKFIPDTIARVSDIPNLSTYEFITTADIDTICGAQIVNASEVNF